jgi:hypothetical protein
MLIAVLNAVLTVAAFVLGYVIGATIEIRRDHERLVRLAGLLDSENRSWTLWRFLAAMQRGEHNRIKIGWRL